jgi:hypothetical protein
MVVVLLGWFCLGIYFGFVRWLVADGEIEVVSFSGAVVEGRGITRRHNTSNSVSSSQSTVYSVICPVLRTYCAYFKKGEEMEAGRCLAWIFPRCCNVGY